MHDINVNINRPEDDDLPQEDVNKYPIVKEVQVLHFCIWFSIF